MSEYQKIYKEVIALLIEKKATFEQILTIAKDLEHTALLNIMKAEIANGKRAESDASDGVNIGGSGPSKVEATSNG
jgi:hypothetical protein